MEFVAKSFDQVWKGIDDSVIAKDADVFKKITQASDSACDLISMTVNEKNNGQDSIMLISPVLIVPGDVLWQVDYSDDGE